MAKILSKEYLHPTIVLMDIASERIAKKAQAGHFIMLRVDDQGERFPLTIADKDIQANSIRIIFQTIGRSTRKLAEMNVGDDILDVVGPLGSPIELPDIQKVAVVGGGVGCAIAYPFAKSQFEMGRHVDFIAGFRSKELIFLEEDMRKVSTTLTMTTDDGSYGRQGFVTEVLKELIESASIDAIVAIGPLPMMKAVSDVSRPYGIKTIVSLNPIMIDGTGMCGGCRVTVDGKVKFACVDGPEFDGHQVDFDELIVRNRSYREIEAHQCRLDEEVAHAKD